MQQAPEPSPGFEHARLTLEAATHSPDTMLDAHYLLWEVCQACGDRETALDHLRQAIEIDPLRSRHSEGSFARRVVLAIAVHGDLQANLPLGMLFDDATELHTLFIADPQRMLDDPAASIGTRLPDLLARIDVAFIAIAEDPRHALALRAADHLVEWLGLPSINRGSRIAMMSRVGASQLLAGCEHCVVPRQSLVSFETVQVRPVFSPFTIRPVGSHCGQGLARISNRRECRRYLLTQPGAREFYVAPFVDFRSADTFYRKFRIAFVDGCPLPAHLAIRDDWAIWYYNVPEHLEALRRTEEARFLTDMAAYLGPRAMVALLAIARIVDLDYFALDCAMMPDGRLVVFEIETGMIVSDAVRATDGPRPARSILGALEALIDRRIAECREPSGEPGPMPGYSEPPRLPIAAPSRSLSAFNRMNPAASR